MEDLPENFRSLMQAYSLNIRLADKKMNAARNDTHLEVKDLDETTVAAVQKVFPHDFDLSPFYKKTPWE